MNSPILELVYRVIDELNEQFDGEKIIEKSENTLLYGKSSILDSLELINFIVLTEQKFEDEFNVHLVLADERAAGRQRDGRPVVAAHAIDRQAHQRQWFRRHVHGRRK